jgi:hypothetical protein
MSNKTSGIIINYKKNNSSNNDELARIINLLINKQFNLFNHLKFLAKEILKDGEINSKDIPNLILFVKDLYVFICSVKRELGLETENIKYMLPYLVKNLVKYFVGEWKEEQMIILENIIDASINLLFYTTEQVVSQTCFSFLFKI